MHYTNQLLPDSERDGLDSDINSSLECINFNIGALNADKCGQYPYIVARILKSVNIHLKLKYELSKDVCIRLSKILIELYTDKNRPLSFDQKIKILQFIRKLVKKKHTYLDYEFVEWREFWNEAISNALRDENWAGNNCNAKLFAELDSSIISFLHDSRRQIPKTDVPLIIKEADVLNPIVFNPNIFNLLLFSSYPLLFLNSKV